MQSNKRDIRCRNRCDKLANISNYFQRLLYFCPLIHIQLLVSIRYSFVDSLENEYITIDTIC